MKKLLYVFLTLSIAACSSIKVSYDYDKNTDFSKFKTYSFTKEALELGIQELNRTRILNAINNELNARGLTKSDNPDVWVDVLVSAEKKQQATATTTGMGGYGGYYGRPYMYGGGFTTTQINYTDYIDGTLFINVVSNNNLVWQGRGTRTLDENASADKREKNINYSVAEIFKKYPVQPAAKK